MRVPVVCVCVLEANARRLHSVWIKRSACIAISRGERERRACTHQKFAKWIIIVFFDSRKCRIGSFVMDDYDAIRSHCRAARWSCWTAMPWNVTQFMELLCVCVCVQWDCLRNQCISSVLVVAVLSFRQTNEWKIATHTQHYWRQIAS